MLFNRFCYGSFLVLGIFVGRHKKMEFSKFCSFFKIPCQPFGRFPKIVFGEISGAAALRRTRHVERPSSLQRPLLPKQYLHLRNFHQLCYFRDCCKKLSRSAGNAFGVVATFAVQLVGRAVLHEAVRNAQHFYLRMVTVFG